MDESVYRRVRSQNVDQFSSPGNPSTQAGRAPGHFSAQSSSHSQTNVPPTINLKTLKNASLSCAKNLTNKLKNLSNASTSRIPRGGHGGNAYGSSQGNSYGSSHQDGRYGQAEGNATHYSANPNSLKSIATRLASSTESIMTHRELVAVIERLLTWSEGPMQVSLEKDRYGAPTRESINNFSIINSFLLEKTLAYVTGRRDCCVFIIKFITWRMRTTKHPEEIILSLELINACVERMGPYFLALMTKPCMRTFRKILFMTTLKHSLASGMKKQITKLLGKNTFVHPGVSTDVRIHIFKAKTLYMIQLWYGPKCGCDKIPQYLGITAKKDPSPLSITGFVAYTHSSKNSFTLKGTLDGNEKLGDGEDITNVTKVSIYYWDGDENEKNAKPLILEVKKDGQIQQEYYIKYESDERELGDKGDTTVWKHQGHSGDISLQDILDDRNCAINKRVPLDIENPNKYLNFSSDRSKGVKIKLTSLQRLNGSEYVVTTYKISDPNLKLSRVEHENKKIGEIVVPENTLDGIRLYSSSGISERLPIALELKSTGGGDAKWYYSKSPDGKGWNNVNGNTSGFYDDKEFSIGKPTEELTNKLDEIVCSNYNSVTIDISYSNSMSHTKSKEKGDEKYCCSVCGNKKVAVEEIEVKDKKHMGSTKIYKHSIEGGGLKLGGIKFYLRDDVYKKNRKRITSGTLRLPADGPIDVYAFYCGDNPVIIYLHYRNNPKNSRWYRKEKSKNADNKPWRKTGQLSSIKSRHLDKEGLSCGNWNKLVDELRKRKCSQLQNCTNSDESSQDSREQLSTADEEGGEENEDSDDEMTEPVKNIGTYGASALGAITSSVLEEFVEKALPQVVKVTKDVIDSKAFKTEYFKANHSNQLSKDLATIGEAGSVVVGELGKQSKKIFDVTEKAVGIVSSAIKTVTGLPSAKPEAPESQTTLAAKVTAPTSIPNPSQPTPKQSPGGSSPAPAAPKKPTSTLAKVGYGSASVLGGGGAVGETFLLDQGVFPVFFEGYKDLRERGVRFPAIDPADKSRINTSIQVPRPYVTTGGTTLPLSPDELDKLLKIVSNIDNLKPGPEFDRCITYLRATKNKIVDSISILTEECARSNSDTEARLLDKMLTLNDAIGTHLKVAAYTVGGSTPQGYTAGSTSAQGFDNDPFRGTIYDEGNNFDKDLAFEDGSDKAGDLLNLDSEESEADDGFGDAIEKFNEDSSRDLFADFDFGDTKSSSFGAKSSSQVDTKKKNYFDDLLQIDLFSTSEASSSTARTLVKDEPSRSSTGRNAPAVWAEHEEDEEEEEVHAPTSEREKDEGTKKTLNEMVSEFDTLDLDFGHMSVTGF
ncbi:hypothetical protein BEWA_027280 [Theileria equi strain WA]|uniref:Uncharacterized protein n=1 Tax=Theileria equi strain WA TaxID=1537102 RepID=L0AYB7_THEEQ|nr:hypothetical protein BEWA_027280 [Theileria equi strain WA]AFZ79879.1 hypothetical protein BEWA_027280 [Theileria equi strain WA]|eukprot:XP_004829545.1 hypothetical protein BEWA_027280 [Theileria equi strain WA]